MIVSYFNCISGFFVIVDIVSHVRCFLFLYISSIICLKLAGCGFFLCISLYYSWLLEGVKHLIDVGAIL